MRASAKRATRLAALAVTLALAGPSWAGRPLDTEDAGTLDPGRFELELSADYARDGDTDVWTARGVLAAGLLPRLEGRVELPVAVRAPAHEGPAVAGPADGVVAVKYRLVDEAATVPVLTIGAGLRVPIGDADRGLGADGIDVAVVGVLGKSVGPVVLHANVGYVFVTADRRRDVWVLAASGEFRVTTELSLVAEALGFLGPHAAQPNTGRARAGVIYAVREDVRLDAAVGHGFGRGSPGTLVTFGVTLGF